MFVSFLIDFKKEISKVKQVRSTKRLSDKGFPKLRTTIRCSSIGVFVEECCIELKLMGKLDHSERVKCLVLFYVTRQLNGLKQKFDQKQNKTFK